MELQELVICITIIIFSSLVDQTFMCNKTDLLATLLGLPRPVLAYIRLICY